MFKDNILRLILSKTFAKKESQQGDQQKTMLGAKKRAKHNIEKMEKLLDPEVELDKASEIISTKEEAPLPSQEDDEDDLILVRMRLQVQKSLNKNLMSKLADANASALSYEEDIKKERNARKMVENMCSELKEQLAVNTKQLDSMKLEVDRIKTAMQIRESALKMKLDDARVMLEKKYDELDYLQGQLEAFVRKNHGSCVLNMKVKNEADILLEEIHMARKSGA